MQCTLRLPQTRLLAVHLRARHDHTAVSEAVLPVARVGRSADCVRTGPQNVGRKSIERRVIANGSGLACNNTSDNTGHNETQRGSGFRETYNRKWGSAIRSCGRQLSLTSARMHGLDTPQEEVVLDSRALLPCFTVIERLRSSGLAAVDV